MTAKDTYIRKDGEKVLNNYKKQLAEKLAREATDNVKGTASNSRLSTESSARPSGSKYSCSKKS